MSQFTVRPASVADARPMAELFAAVAEERSGIASEPPVDVEQRTAQFTASIAESIVAVADGQIVGMIHTDVRRYGVGELGMLVDCEWRGRGVGSALIQATIAWARDQGLHKLSLEVFAQNTAAIALYRKCGFVEEGHRVKHYRRANGELWDSLIMGLPLSVNKTGVCRRKARGAKSPRTSACAVRRRPASPGSGAAGRAARPRTAPARRGCAPRPGVPPR